MNVLTIHNVSTEVNDDALSFMIYALGNNALRAIQNYSTVKDAWDTVQVAYAGKSLINKWKTLNSLVNIKLIREEKIRDHIANMETKLSSLVAMNDPINGSTGVATSIS